MWRIVDAVSVFAGWESEGGCGGGEGGDCRETGVDGVGGCVWRIVGFVLGWGVMEMRGREWKESNEIWDRWGHGIWSSVINH